jgi:hypothetical protein
VSSYCIGVIVEQVDAEAIGICELVLAIGLAQHGHTCKGRGFLALAASYLAPCRLTPPNPSPIRSHRGGGPV